MAQTTSRKGGRPSRGKRAAQIIRMPEDHLSVYTHQQQALGYESLNAYLTAVLAGAHELPVPEWAQPRSNAHQQQLPIPEWGKPHGDSHEQHLPTGT